MTINSSNTEHKNTGQIAQPQGRSNPLNSTQSAGAVDSSLVEPQEIDAGHTNTDSRSLLSTLPHALALSPYNNNNNNKPLDGIITTEAADINCYESSNLHKELPPKREISRDTAGKPGHAIPVERSYLSALPYTAAYSDHNNNKTLDYLIRVETAELAKEVATIKAERAAEEQHKRECHGEQRRSEQYSSSITKGLSKKNQLLRGDNECFDRFSEKSQDSLPVVGVAGELSKNSSQFSALPDAMSAAAPHKGDKTLDYAMTIKTGREDEAARTIKAPRIAANHRENGGKNHANPQTPAPVQETKQTRCFHRYLFCWYIILRLFTPPATGERKATKYRFWLNVLAIANGALVVVETGFNVKLRQVLGGNSIRSAWFCSIICSFLLFLCSLRYLRASRVNFRQSWTNDSIFFGSKWHNCWNLGGGVIGALFTVIAIEVVYRVGMAPFFVSTIVGGMVASLFFDYYALLGYDQERPLPKLKIAGVCFTLVGRVMQDWTTDENVETTRNTIVASVFLGVFAGFLQPVQAGVNNLLNSQRIKQPVVTALFHSLVSSLVLSIACIFTLIYESFVDFDYQDGDGSKWLGGIFKAISICLTILLPPALGVANYFVASLGGILAASVINDAVGILTPSIPRKFNGLSYAGTALAFVGVCCIAGTKAHHAKLAIQRQAAQKMSEEEIARAKEAIYHKKEERSPGIELEHIESHPEEVTCQLNDMQQQFNQLQQVLSRDEQIELQNQPSSEELQGITQEIGSEQPHSDINSADCGQKKNEGKNFEAEREALHRPLQEMLEGVESHNVESGGNNNGGSTDRSTHTNTDTNNINNIYGNGNSGSDKENDKQRSERKASETASCDVASNIKEQSSGLDSGDCCQLKSGPPPSEPKSLSHILQQSDHRPTASQFNY
jgi:transporter family-2 protein